MKSSQNDFKPLRSEHLLELKKLVLKSIRMIDSRVLKSEHDTLQIQKNHKNLIVVVYHSIKNRF